MPELTSEDIKRGQLWQLGKHRLYCGDATISEDIEKLVSGYEIGLVFQDPPYGIDIVNAGGHFHGKGKKAFQVYTGFIGDKDDTACRLNYELICKYPKLIIWGGQFFSFLPRSQGWLIWDKKVNIDNYSACEMAWTSFYGHNKIYTHRWCGFMKAGSRRLNPVPRIHPTQKPVELYMAMLRDFSNEGDVVLDCFSGSGTTIIACEETGRICLSMELSLHYCREIINRYMRCYGCEEVMCLKTI